MLYVCEGLREMYANKSFCRQILFCHVPSLVTIIYGLLLYSEAVDIGVQTRT